MGATVGSVVVYHAVHDALGSKEIATVAWRRFEDTADPSRPKHDGDALYAPRDGVRKVADELGLLREGRLPPQANLDFEAPAVQEAHPAEAARAMLDAAFEEARAKIDAWRARRRRRSVSARAEPRAGASKP